MKMTKRLTIIANDIDKAEDLDYVNDTYDAIISSLCDYADIVSNLFFEKNEKLFLIKCTIKVCKEGDLLRILIFEFLSCIRQTENKIGLSISEADEGCPTGVIYKFYNFVPDKE